MNTVNLDLKFYPDHFKSELGTDLIVQEEDNEK